MKKTISIKEIIYLTLVFILALFAIQVYAKRGLQGRESLNKNEWGTGNPTTYIVESVIEGDTIRVGIGNKVEKVRLIGIDCPESQPNDKAKRDAKRTGQDIETINKMGQEATEFVKGLIKPGQEVRLEFDVQRKDKYGRLLAYVYVFECALCDIEAAPGFWYETFDDGLYLFLNKTIISKGYATPMTIPPNVKYVELFEKLYKEAREQKRGLWKEEME